MVRAGLRPSAIYEGRFKARESLDAKPELFVYIISHDTDKLMGIIKNRRDWKPKTSGAFS